MEVWHCTGDLTNALNQTMSIGEVQTITLSVGQDLIDGPKGHRAQDRTRALAENLEISNFISHENIFLPCTDNLADAGTRSLPSRSVIALLSLQLE